MATWSTRARLSPGCVVRELLANPVKMDSATGASVPWGGLEIAAMKVSMWQHVCSLYGCVSYHLSFVDIQVSVPSFNATSFLRFSPLGVPPSTVALSFNPATAHGLLFHHGDLTINRDFVSISVIEQQVEFRFDLGSGPAILMSEPVSLNDWHYVQATREGRNGVLQVDGGAVVTGQSEGTLTILNVNSDIFVGGVADYDTVSPHAGTEVGLIGCIMDLEVGHSPRSQTTAH